MKATVGFLLFHEVEELDFVGPWEVIAIWSKYYHGPKKMVTVSEEGGIVTCANSLQLMASHHFSNCPKLDYLVVPGGWGTRAEVNNKKLIDFIKRISIDCKVILSVCTGAFLLQAAGLLDGKKATTHWHSMDRLRAYTKTTVVAERVIKDGGIWSAAGISAGIDAALAMVADIAGETIAGEVQLQMEYYPSSKYYGELRDLKGLPEYLKNRI